MPEQIPANEQQRNDSEQQEQITPPPGTDPKAAPPAGDGKTASNGKPFATNDKNESLGYPADTAVAEMTAEEGREYWKHKSRKHENRADASVSKEDHDKVLAELTELKTKGQTDEQRQTTEALATAKQEGYAEAEAFFRPLLNEVQLVGFATTVLGYERAQAWVTSANADSFKSEDGNIDGVKVQTYLKTLFGESNSDNGTQQVTPPSGTYQNSGQFQQQRKAKPDHKAQAAAQLERRGVKPQAAS